MEKLNERELLSLFENVEPLCVGDTSDLLEWIRAGNDGADLRGRTAAEIAAEWNEIEEAT